jgi:hypothetical protein
MNPPRGGARFYVLPLQEWETLLPRASGLNASGSVKPYPAKSAPDNLSPRSTASTAVEALFRIHLNDVTRST